MRLVYIAGKYTGNSYSEIEDNIRAAEKVAIKIIQQKGKFGWFPVVPHLNTRHFERYSDIISHANYRYYLDGTKELMRRCDAVVFIDGWETSHGATIEYDEAMDLDLPIYEEHEIEELGVE